jgi:asparagine synthase (glutamine-hydrolysing)
MVHRGPDDEGYEQRQLGADPDRNLTLGLGFRRLSILDLSSAGHQPMVDPSTGNCLVFNGEIFNFRQLRGRLQAEGVAFTSSGDTEVLLQALSRWGDRALEELDGMFAFAFYEARKHRVLLARDHIGIKPLYVARPRGGLIFASEIRALLASGLVSDTLDPAGIASFLAYGSPQDPLTVLQDVQSFPAGSSCWYSADACTAPALPTPTRYWHFPPPDADEVDEQLAANQLEDLLETTVGEQALADVPLAVFLSAGIDSGMLAALATRVLPSLHTHSVGFEAYPAEDELADAKVTAAAIGSVHRQTVLTATSMHDLWDRWMDAADRPSIDGLNTYVVSGAVKQAGVTVALSGAGADEIFGGYSHYRSIPSVFRRLQPLALLPAPLRRSLASVAGRLMSGNRRNRAMDLVAHLHSPFDLLLWHRRIFTNAELTSFGMRSDDLGLSRHYLPQEQQERLDSGPQNDTFQPLARADCELYLSHTLLRDMDVNSMAHSLEVRVPFLARRVMEYAARLPASLHLPAGGTTKHLLRTAGRNLLPAAVFNRPKTGFTLPIDEWMLGPNRESCTAAVDAVVACSLFDAGAVQARWQTFVTHPKQSSWYRPLAIVALGNYLMRLKGSCPQLPSAPFRLQ